MVTGILVVDKSVTVQLLESAVDRIKVYGKIQAEPDILAIIRKKGKIKRRQNNGRDAG